MTNSPSANSQQVVIGDGWAALSAVAYLLKNDKDVCWIAATGARLAPPLPSFEAGDAASAWAELAHAYAIETGGEEPGSFLREFRNKAFREPMWARAAEPEARRDVQRETLWTAERFLVGTAESRFAALTSGELEEQLRAAVLASPRLNRIEGVPVESFVAVDGRITEVTLASGVRIAGENVIYADAWEELPRIFSASTDLPASKTALSFTKKREPMGALQATFQHSRRVGAEAPILEGFFNSLRRETGEDFDRHVLGYFTSDGLRSHWTVCLTEAEVEDNHEIAKRLKRMKAALESMFTGDPWTTAEAPSFLATVQSEQVRFADGVLFGEGEPPKEPQKVSAISHLTFLTDGYGPSHAVILARQAVAAIAPGLFEQLQAGTQAQAEDVNLEPGIENS